jgi:hypothetical protein
MGPFGRDIMKESSFPLNRRSFLRAAGLVGAGALLPASRATAQSATPAAPSDMPLRTFGRSGIRVPILSMGGMFDITTSQLLLRQALQLGITYWDTAAMYTGGKSEIGIGQFFEREPAARKQVFLVTKASGAGANPAKMTPLLDQSLERLKTDAVDLYFLHGISSAKVLTPEVKAWAEVQKKAGRIRLFGFSTHTNMAECLAGCAGLGWIDGVMTTYNYRLMHEDAMRRAIDACVKAGIGVTAMKTMGGGQVKTESEAERALGGRFLERGFTMEQAKLKAVWADERVSAICSQMPNATLMRTNAAAALDRIELTARDLDDLRRIAAENEATYCAGCANLCEAAAPGGAPVSDILRALMYDRSYGQLDQAREVFAAMHPGLRAQLPHLDYRAAEANCPRHLPIAQWVREASERCAC